MLHSKYCKLHSKTSGELCSLGESPHEAGGYFIVKGSEKVVLSQEDAATNVIYTRIDSNTNNYIASIESVHGSSAPEKFYLTYDVVSKTISATIPYLRGSIPLIILFRALGLETEKSIIESVVGTRSSKHIIELLGNELIHSIQDVQEIYTQEMALMSLSILTKYSADKVSYEKWKGNLLYVLNSRFLPHVGQNDNNYMESLESKCAFF